MALTPQEQKSGDSSINLQAGGNISLGITYAEARQIAQDIFNANFVKLSEDAHAIAKQRADELVSDYLRQLEQRNPAAIESTRDPDMQFDLYTSQKEYARSGDKDLGAILVDILVDRASTPERSLLQVVLNESLSVAPKLTSYQFNILSLVFVLRYTRRLNVGNLPQLGAYLKSTVLPLLDGVHTDVQYYEHLEYAGCGSFNPLSTAQVPVLIKKNYPGLFAAGGDTREIDELRAAIPSVDGLVRPCLNDPTKFQLNALNDDVIQKYCQEHELSEEACSKLINFQHSHLLGDDKALEMLVELDERMKSLVEIWNASKLGNLSLTSVGKAIAHANIRRKTGQNYDLSIWIR